MRTIIDLPEESIKALAELCKREGISRAEAIRRAVNAMLEKKPPPTMSMREAAAAWRKFGLPFDDGLEYQRRIRAEWDE